MRPDDEDLPTKETFEAYRFMGKTPLTFGRHIGCTYQHVYFNYRPYAAWAVQTAFAPASQDAPATGELLRFATFCNFADKHPELLDP